MKVYRKKTDLSTEVSDWNELAQDRIPIERKRWSREIEQKLELQQTNIWGEDERVAVGHDLGEKKWPKLFKNGPISQNWSSTIDLMALNAVIIYYGVFKKHEK